MPTPGPTEPGGPDELIVSLVSRRKISQVNEQFLGHQGPTDVITFDYRDAVAAEPGAAVLAEILVCPEVAAVAAVEHGHPVGQEVVLYVVHGLLHLAGHDDHTPSQRRAMRAAERRVMRPLLQEFRVDAIFS